ncbi:carbohydrate ABC transporter permease [Fictibacillus phosphorivorans]|uniref:carbohydrate ABC transporter permease n=1 Tax=Fictibacillus phosphorivorans TaxID=1221500 RepID=UPI00203DE3F0|nr:carbohydrate ABC transporter permease [Fictibacillus phosphorivorans]MCM3718869.1 carbohydrate ABC transporter permease [Fictibacillus phosphorivorans]MCM3776491.1 carbohydrate ABC transporter permease [Fictibacillus phosphorivorans]
MKKTKIMKNTFIYGLLSIVLLIFLGPYIWMFMTAVKTQGDVMVWPPKIIPSEFHWENFLKIWQETNLPRAFFNSFIVSVVATAINVFLASLAAFAFARLKFPGRNKLFLMVLATMMIPSGLMVVPLFFMMKNMPFSGPNGWLDSYSALILPFAVTGFAIFLLRQNFLSVPKELDEQATIDGCNKFQIYWKIILPLNKPGLALVAIFSFLSHWNEYLWPLTVARSQEMYTIQIALKAFQTQYNIDWPLIMAGATTAALPMIILYFVLQPLFEQGLGGMGSTGKE